jgi:hypothetical protein
MRLTIMVACCAMGVSGCAVLNTPVPCTAG